MEEAIQLLEQKIGEAKLLKAINENNAEINSYCNERIKFLTQAITTLIHVKEHNAEMEIEYLK
jgi:hypothetical protein